MESSQLELDKPTPPKSVIDSASPSLYTTESGESSTTGLNNIRKKLHILDQADTADSSHSIRPCGAQPGVSQEDDNEREPSTTNSYVALAIAQSGALGTLVIGARAGRAILVMYEEKKSGMLHNTVRSGITRTTTRG